ncbi:uncharacterized protein LOC112554579 isoform X2 [Pomacea canaliculata]|uniref:uncharacterized protein LOC112554579 isoform X2 n=1 Tax=Pomacea canaliculata TaxID=400727 RepID=UPI000D72DF2C|nr:uncharacterized protein LOC112554579 isoform X2 [Pomacea canaliculata]
MENLSDVEKSTLQRLQDAYCKENKALSFPLLPQHCTSAASVTITPQSAQSAGDRTHFSGDSTSGSEGQNSLKRQNSLLARGRLMVSKAKQKLDEVDGCTPGFMSASQRQDVGDFDNIDLKTVHDLEKYIQEQYVSTVSSGVGLETTMQTLVTVTLHFMSQGVASSCPQETTVELLRQKLLKSSLDLKAHYESLTSQEDNKKKITEYKLQVLLRLELESICASLDSSRTDQTTNEILNFLRALVFITDTSEVSQFLNTTIAANYASSVPQMLVSIYDELMQPLPPSLAGFGSPTTVSSVTQEALSVSSHLSNDLNCSHLDGTQSQSSQSRRSRSLRSHPSLSELGTKRQIMIEAKPQQKTKIDSKEKGAQKALKNKGKGKKTGPCRSLFENARGQKHEGKKQDLSVSLKNTRSSPRRKGPKADSSPHSSRRPLVVETPARQQHNRAVWLQQQRERQRTNQDAANVQVVEESPVKEATQTSPVVFKPVRRVLRKAFYSAGHVNRSRSLVRAEELSACIAGRRHPLQGKGGARLSDALLGEKSIMSPTRQAQSFLHAQLIKSPSFGQVTPPRPRHVKPDPTTPSQNTRSKHLEDLSVFSSDDGDVMPESKLSRVVSALSFTSPVKDKDASLLLKTPPRKEGKKVCITPRRKRVVRAGWIAKSPEEVFQIDSSSHNLRQSCSAFTSPSKANVAELHSGLSENFMSDVSSPITRSKHFLLAGSTMPSTSRTESSLTKNSSEKQERECSKQLTSLSDGVSARLSRCEMTENGDVQEVVSGSAPGCRKTSRRERSPVVQSSILDFVSPTRRVRKDLPSIDVCSDVCQNHATRHFAIFPWRSCSWKGTSDPIKVYQSQVFDGL